MNPNKVTDYDRRFTSGAIVVLIGIMMVCSAACVVRLRVNFKNLEPFDGTFVRLLGGKRISGLEYRATDASETNTATIWIATHVYQRLEPGDLITGQISGREIVELTINNRLEFSYIQYRRWALWGLCLSSLIGCFLLLGLTRLLAKRQCHP